MLHTGNRVNQKALMQFKKLTLNSYIMVRLYTCDILRMHTKEFNQTEGRTKCPSTKRKIASDTKKFFFLSL